MLVTALSIYARGARAYDWLVGSPAEAEELANRRYSALVAVEKYYRNGESLLMSALTPRRSKSGTVTGASLPTQDPSLSPAPLLSVLASGRLL